MEKIGGNKDMTKQPQKLSHFGEEFMGNTTTI